MMPDDRLLSVGHIPVIKNFQETFRACSIGWLSLAIFLVMGAACADTVVFDGIPEREFGGLGAQIWATPEFTTERDSLLRDLHITWARVGVGPTIPEEQLAEHMSVEDILALIQRHRDEPINQLISRHYVALSDEVKRMGLRLHFISWSPPKRWTFTFNWQGSTVHELGAPGQTDHLVDYANFVVAQLLYAKENGLEAEALEFVNEPDAYNSSIKPPAYVRELEMVRATLNRYGFKQVMIEGPGTSSTYNAARFLAELQRTDRLGLLGRLSVHDYDTVKLPEPAGLGGLKAEWPDLDKLSAKLPIYVTEFGNNAPHWHQDPKNGSRVAVGNSPEFGVAIAAEALKLLSDGASAIAVWQLQDMPWDKESQGFGLLDLQGHRRPAAHALGAVFGQLPADTRVMSGKGASPGLGAAAFRTKTGIFLGLANASSSQREVNVSVPGVNVRYQDFKVLSSYPPVKDLPLKGSKGQLSLSVPPRTVISLASTASSPSGKGRTLRSK